MEKRSSLFCIGLLLQLCLVIFGFGTGTMGMKSYIVHNESISFPTEFLISFLGAFVFIVGYFVGVFVVPGPTPKSCLLASIGAVWGLLIIGVLLMSILNDERPIQSFLLAIYNYSMTGLIFAWASTRIRTVVKP